MAHSGVVQGPLWLLIRFDCHDGPSWPSIRDLDIGLLALADPLGFTVTAGLEECLDFDSDPAHVRLARSFVARTLRKWKLGALVNDAQLVVSELASNAVLHSGGEVRVTLRSDGRFWVRIELRDDNPACRSPSPSRTTRRAVEACRSSTPCLRAGAWVVRKAARRCGLSSP